MSYIDNIDAQIAALMKMREQEQSFCDKITAQEKSSFLNMLKNPLILNKVCNDLGFKSEDAKLLYPLLIKRVDAWNSEVVKNQELDSKNSGKSEVKFKVKVADNESCSDDSLKSDFVKKFFGDSSLMQINSLGYAKSNKRIPYPSLNYNIHIFNNDIKYIYCNDAVNNLDENTPNFNVFTLYNLINNETFVSSSGDSMSLRALTPICIKLADKFICNDGILDLKQEFHTKKLMRKQDTFNALLTLISCNFKSLNINKLLMELIINKSKDTGTFLDMLVVKYSQSSEKIGFVNSQDIRVEYIYDFFHWFTIKLFEKLGNSNKVSVDLADKLFKEIIFYSPFNYLYQGGLDANCFSLDNRTKMQELKNAYSKYKDTIVARKEVL